MKYHLPERIKKTGKGLLNKKYFNSLLTAIFGIALLHLTITSNGQTLGTYPDATVIAGQNTTVTPGAVPTNTTAVVAYSNTNFTGILSVNPATGVVSVTNAKQAGNYPVAVKAFGTATTTQTFNLTVSNPNCSKGLFSGSTEVNVGSGNVSVAIGDFNNDGKQDLAVANGNVAIRLGDGNGGFAGSTLVPVGGKATDVAVGDFNGDGNQDFATANEWAHTVSIRLGNGMGGFTGNTNLAVGELPTSIAVGDFNRDGKQDLAVTCMNLSFISIVLGDGQGEFFAGNNIDLSNSVPSPNSIAIGDFNNDGNQDLAVAGGGGVSIQLGDGNGGFTASPIVMVGEYPWSIALGDFNGDGIQDFATANDDYANNVSIRLGDGLGGFSGSNEVNVGFVGSYISIGDFNGDGKQDFAVGHWEDNSVSIRLGDGIGGFSGSTNIGVAGVVNSIAIGDFNNDGLQDFATANSTSQNVSIRLGEASDINLQGNGITISDGDVTPAVADFTDFGNVNIGSSLTRTFTIQNKGIVALSIIKINCTNPLFIIGDEPGTVSAGSSASFTVTFYPTAPGVQNATLTINNDDCDELAYDFAIKGLGTGDAILTWYKDADNDGYSDGTNIGQPLRPEGYKLAEELTATTGDCNDSDANINPGAIELCDGIDNNCNGQTDEGVMNTWYEDNDNDGYSSGRTLVQCSQPDGYKLAGNLIATSGDCNDAYDNIHPGAKEVCDGMDNNCDGQTDEGVMSTWYQDYDKDGYSNGTTRLSCGQPEGYKLAGDLLATSGDCNDNNPNIHPGATEVCDGMDNNCNGQTDEGVMSTWYKDYDKDGYSNGTTMLSCGQPEGYKLAGDLVSTTGDCNDDNANIHPGATELCDGIDNDCDAQTDEGCPVGTSWYFDYDNDGYGNPNKKVQAITRPRGYIATSGDCRDWDATFHPGATELCDGKDNDCDGVVDEGCNQLKTWYRDGDRDGYGNPKYTKIRVFKPEGFVDNDDDCKDWDANVYPGHGCPPLTGIGITDGNVTQPKAMVETSTDIQVFPNPARNEITVTLNGFEVGKKLELQMVQADGKVVSGQSLTPFTRGQQVRINVSRLSAGYYLLQVRQGVMQQTKKVMIVR